MSSQEDEEEIHAWQEQLVTYRRNLTHLLQQAAQFGGENSVPVHIANDLFETRTNIQRLKAQLRAANVSVHDLSDEEAPATPAWKRSPSRLYLIAAIVVGGSVAVSLLFWTGAMSFGRPSAVEQPSDTPPSSMPQTTGIVSDATPSATTAPALVAPDITAVAMIRQSYVTTGGRSIRLIVIRATTGTAPGDYNVLRSGGISTRIVSDHYYIDKNGTITQFVQDKDIAFHAGTCNWVVDGEQIADKMVTINNQEISVCNALSIAVTLSNRNDGEDSYTALQYDSLLTLTRYLIKKYDIPQSQLVRSSDISSKQPLNGFPQWSRFVAQVYDK